MIVLPTGATRRVKGDGTKKTRMHVGGHRQVKHRDYKDCSSPVISWTSLLIVMFIQLLIGGICIAIDSHQAFIQVEVNTPVFISPLKGFPLHDDLIRLGMVLKLRRALYGLHQSSLLYFIAVCKFLIENGFTQLCSDECVFFRIMDGAILILAVYVDDIYAVARDKATLDDFYKLFSTRFDCKMRSKVNEFLGTALVVTASSITFYNPRQIADFFVIMDLDPKSTTIRATPANPSVTLEKERSGDQLLDDLKYAKYRSAVGTLIFIATRSRPDICSAVRELSRYVAAPRMSHWTALVWCAQYLAGTHERGVTMSTPTGHDPATFGTTVNVYAYIDASFNSTWDGFSVTGFLISIFGLISWGSFMQRHVVSSSTEAEIDAVHDVSLELLWIQGFLSELGLHANIHILEDNTATIGFIKNSNSSIRSKHMRLRFRRARDLFLTYGWQIEYIETRRQLADFLTKALKSPEFLRLVSEAMGWGTADVTALFRRLKLRA